MANKITLKQAYPKSIATRKFPQWKGSIQEKFLPSCFSFPFFSLPFSPSYPFSPLFFYYLLNVFLIYIFCCVLFFPFTFSPPVLISLPICYHDIAAFSRMSNHV